MLGDERTAFGEMVGLVVFRRVAEDDEEAARAIFGRELLQSDRGGADHLDVAFARQNPALAAEDDGAFGQAELLAEAGLHLRRELVHVERVVDDFDLFATMRKELRRRFGDADDLLHAAAGGQAIVDGAHERRQRRVAHVPEGSDAGGLGERAAREVGVGAVAVDEVVLAGLDAFGELANPLTRAEQIADEADGFLGCGGVEVVTLDRAVPRLDRVFDEAGLETDVVDHALAAVFPLEEVGDDAVPRKHDRPMHHERVEKLQDVIKASARSAVPSGVVDEEDADLPDRRNRLLRCRVFDRPALRHASRIAARKPRKAAEKTGKLCRT